MAQVPHECGSLPSAVWTGLRIKILDDDRELGIFIGDLVGAMEHNNQAEDRHLAQGNLLVEAQRCTKVSRDTIWTR